MAGALVATGRLSGWLTVYGSAGRRAGRRVDYAIVKTALQTMPIIKRYGRYIRLTPDAYRACTSFFDVEERSANLRLPFLPVLRGALAIRQESPK